MSQPSSRGRMTLWPRLEMGKSSLNPWRSPSRTACPYEMSASGAAITRSALRPHAGAGLEPGEHEGAEPEHERGDAVLHVMVRRAGLVAGQPAGERLRRLREVDDCDCNQGDAGDGRGDDGPAV